MIYDNPRSRSFLDICPRSLKIQHFQTSFPQKTLGRLKPNFIWTSMGCWDENLFKWPTHDQGGFQAHIW